MRLNSLSSSNEIVIRDEHEFHCRSMSEIIG